MALRSPPSSINQALSEEGTGTAIANQALSPIRHYRQSGTQGADLLLKAAHMTITLHRHMP